MTNKRDDNYIPMCMNVGWYERRIDELESLVAFMKPFFASACSHECGCPDDYFEPHGCDDGCKALKELDERMTALGIEV